MIPSHSEQHKRGPHARIRLCYSPSSGSKSSPKFPSVSPAILLSVIPTIVRQMTLFYLIEMTFVRGPFVLPVCWILEMDSLSLPTTLLLVIGEVGKLKPQFSNPLRPGCWVCLCDLPVRCTRSRFGM